MKISDISKKIFFNNMFIVLTLSFSFFMMLYPFVLALFWLMCCPAENYVVIYQDLYIFFYYYFCFN